MYGSLMSFSSPSRSEVRAIRLMKVDSPRCDNPMNVPCGGKTAYKRAEARCTCKANKAGLLPHYNTTSHTWTGKPCPMCERGVLAAELKLPLGARATYGAYRTVIHASLRSQYPGMDVLPIAWRHIYAPDSSATLAVALSAVHHTDESFALNPSALRVARDNQSMRAGNSKTKMANREPNANRKKARQRAIARSKRGLQNLPAIAISSKNTKLTTYGKVAKRSIPLILVGGALVPLY